MLKNLPALLQILVATRYGDDTTPFSSHTDHCMHSEVPWEVTVALATGIAWSRCGACFIDFPSW